ncbi:uncharacterized protein TNCV_6911 [Trichonephila clavipes]|nr:uncharacterized protein TNCV_6911 [Trichonephila clavipes]
MPETVDTVVGKTGREERKKKRTRKDKKRARKDKGWSFSGSGEENPRVLFCDADQESKRRMRNNALWTGPRQAVEDKEVANPEGLIRENICEEKYTIGTLMGGEKQLTMNQESFRNHTIAKIAGQLNGGENMCKADVRKGLEDRSNIGSEFNFEIDLPGKRDRSTIYCLNLIKLYRRKPELANLVMENSSEGIDSETLYSVKLFMDFGFQGNLRKSQVYFKLPPDRSSYLRMINAKKKERFLPDPGTIVLRQKDINLVTGKPFRIKTCCSSQMSINSLREDTEYLLDLGVNGRGQSNRTQPVVWLERVNRYPYPRIKLLCEGDTKNRWRDGQVCPDVDKELWRLGPDGSGEKAKRSEEEDEEKSGENGREEKGRRRRGDERRRQERRRKKRAESGNWRKKTMNAGGVENGNMN